MAKYLIQDTTLTNICDSIRTKEGSSGTIPVTQIASRISAIETGKDVSSVTATAGDVISGKVFVDAQGNPVNGTLVVQTYYYGADEPSADLGEDGDLYFKMEG